LCLYRSGPELPRISRFFLRGVRWQSEGGVAAIRSGGDKAAPVRSSWQKPLDQFPRHSPMRLVWLARLLLLLCLAASRTAVAKAKKKSDVADELLYLTDSTLEAALEAHPLLLISVSVPGCGVCDAVDKRLRKAAPELRVKAKAAVKLGQLRIDSPDSPVLGRIVQGALSLPKLIVFREGEALDYTGDDSKESIVKTMLALASRDTVQTLRSVKQARSPRTQPRAPTQYLPSVSRARRPSGSCTSTRGALNTRTRRSRLASSASSPQTRPPLTRSFATRRARLQGLLSCVWDAPLNLQGPFP